MHIISDIVEKDGKRYTRYWNFDVDVVEQKKNAKFVCELCGKLPGGDWAETPLAVFWQETPPVEGYSNYFGLLVHPLNNKLYITSAASVAADPFVGVVAENGEIVYSAYRHDFRHSTDGTVFIDGGRDYTKVGVLAGQDINLIKYVTLKIVKDKIEIVEQLEPAQTEQSDQPDISWGK